MRSIRKNRSCWWSAFLNQCRAHARCSNSSTLPPTKLLLSQVGPADAVRPAPPLLRGKRIALLFYEASTRTRVSFEFAAKLWAPTLRDQRHGLQHRKRRVSGGYRQDPPGAGRRRHCRPPSLPRRAARACPQSSGPYHQRRRRHALSIPRRPCWTLHHPAPQAVSKGLRVTMVGDIQHSRVVRSNAHLLSKFGAQIVLCGPPDLAARLARASRPRSQGLPPYRRSCAESRRRDDAARAERTPRRPADLTPKLHCPIPAHAGAPEAGQDRRHRHASRPHCPRHGDPKRSRRRPAIRH